MVTIAYIWHPTRKRYEAIVSCYDAFEMGQGLIFRCNESVWVVPGTWGQPATA